MNINSANTRKRANLFTAIAAVLCLVLLTGAALDKYTIEVNSAGAIRPPFSNSFWTANTTRASNAWSQTFASSNALHLLSAGLNTESNRITTVADHSIAVSNFTFAVSNLVWVQSAGQVVLSNGVTVLSNGVASLSNSLAGLYQPLDAQLTQVAAVNPSGNAGKVVGVNAGGTALELLTVSGGGGGTSWPPTNRNVVIQEVFYPYTNKFFGTAVIPVDNTIPQSNEGTAVVTNSFTSIGTNSLIKVEFLAHVNGAASLTISGALFLNSDTNAFGASDTRTTIQNETQPLITVGIFTNTTPSSFDVQFRVGPSGANTIYINRGNAASLSNLFQNVYISGMTIKEITL